MASPCKSALRSPTPCRPSFSSLRKPPPARKARLASGDRRKEGAAEGVAGAEDGIVPALIRASRRSSTSVPRHVPASHDGAQRRRDGGDFLLDEVPLRPDAQCPHDVFVVGEGGQEHDAGVVVGAEDELGGIEAAHAGHLDVHQQHVRAFALVEIDGLFAASSERADLDVVLSIQDGRKRHAHERVVIDHHRSDLVHFPSSPCCFFGMEANTRNPLRCSARNLPPSAPMRSSMVCRPMPREEAEASPEPAAVVPLSCTTS